MSNPLTLNVQNFIDISVAGRLTNDPRVVEISGGKRFTSFGLAVNVGTKESKETIFYDVTVWGKQGDNIANKIKKGSPVTLRQASITGVNRWNNAAGVEVVTHKINAGVVDIMSLDDFPNTIDQPTEAEKNKNYV